MNVSFLFNIYELNDSNRIGQTESVFFEFRLYCFEKKGGV